jgi:hypothetical protein
MSIAIVSRATPSAIHRLDLSMSQSRWSRLQPGIAVARDFDRLS